MSDWPQFRLNGWDRSEDSKNNYVLELGFFRVRLHIDRHLFYVSRRTKPFPSLAHAEQYVWDLIVDTFQDINQFVLAHERSMTTETPPPLPPDPEPEPYNLFPERDNIPKPKRRRKNRPGDEKPCLPGAADALEANREMEQDCKE